MSNHPEVVVIGGGIMGSSALFELTPNEQEGMLAHEVAHLVRRDPQWLVVARVIETLCETLAA